MTQAAPKSQSWRVFLVDDHPIVRQGLRTALESTSEFSVVGEADNGDDALSAIGLLQPDVVLLDIRIKGAQSGVELAGKLRALRAGMRIVVLTNHPQEPYVRAMIEAGVDGYLLKDTPPNQIITALGMVVQGRNVYSDSINASIVTGYLKSEGTGDLTAREAEVLQLVADGMSNEQIAEKLNLGQKAVQLHLSRVYAKLGVSGRAEAIVQGAKRGLVVIDQPA
jgi:two-component system nitrate/nitrite response regulator NarP